MNRPNNPPGEAGHVAVVRAGRRLQYATMAWNAAECVVALTAGFVAASIALVGFGFDSAIEVTSSVAALWRLWRDPDEARREASERRAMQIIGAWLGYWWADPLAGVAMVPIIAWEGLEAVRGRTCCAD